MVPDLYAIDGSWSVSRLERRPYGGDGEDLRRLLEQNPGLLPGSRDGDPEGWLLVGRDLRSTPPPGGAEWTVDYLFVDRDGVPTFVDCKSPLEARRRHEVIGRMLEYAAMAQTSWGRNDLSDWLQAEGREVEDAVGKLLGSFARAPEDFLDDVVDKLSAGMFRLVFVVGEATAELRRVVDFLNQQMRRAQVFVIEARQYEAAGVRILAPAVFGPGREFSPLVGPESRPNAGGEESEPLGAEPGAEFEATEDEPEFESADGDPELETVRELALEMNEIDGFSLEGPEPEAEEPGIAGESSFFEAVDSRLADDQLRSVRTFYEVAQKLAFDLDWGNGEQGPSLEVGLTRISEKPLLSLRADGTLTLNFGALAGDSGVHGYQQRFRSIAHNRLDLVFHLDEMHPPLRPTDWCPKITGVLRVLDDLAMMAGQTSAPPAV